MEKNNKKIIKLIVAAVVVIAIIVLAVVVVKNNKTNNKSKNASSDQGEELTLETVIIDDSKKDKDKDPWEDVSIIEETSGDGYIKDENGEYVTTKKGKKIKESYPGEGNGWSPIVPANEVGK